MKLIDENEPDIDSNNYENVHDYHTVFKPNRTCMYLNLLSCY